MSEEQKQNAGRGQTRAWRRSTTSLFKWTVLIVVGIPLVWFTFCEARKGYWDWRVTQMCEKDGGVVVYEKTKAPPEYVDRDGNIRIPAKPSIGRSPFSWEAKAGDSFYYESDRCYIRRNNPVVALTVLRVVRAIDEKVMGEGRFYGRSGGDAFVVDHHSSFRCPPGGENELFKSIFLGGR